MGINLSKGERINLSKEAPSLKKVGVGLGWDTNTTDTGTDFDLDASVFMLGADGKIPNEKNFIFYNNLSSPDGGVKHTGDNLTGAGDGDDEQIIVKLNDLSTQYQKVIFVVQIYKGVENKQHFGQVKNAFIRAVDATGKEMVRFNLSGTGQYDNQRSLLFAELVREAGDWKFNAVGSASPSDSFVEWLKQYS